MNRDFVDREWLWNSTAVYVMLVAFVAVGMATVEVPLDRWMKVLSSCVIGTWMPLWFYDRMASTDEACDRLRLAATFGVLMLATGMAIVLTVENHPFSHIAIMTGLAALQALNRGFRSVAEFLGTGAAFLVALAAVA